MPALYVAQLRARYVAHLPARYVAHLPARYVAQLPAPRMEGPQAAGAPMAASGASSAFASQDRSSWTLQSLSRALRS